MDFSKNQENANELLSLNYEDCFKVFTPKFIAKYKIDPQFKAAMCTGKEYADKFLSLKT